MRALSEMIIILGVWNPCSILNNHNKTLCPKSMCRPVGGVYMAATGYMFSRAGINVHCIITSVGGFTTPDLHSFKGALERLVYDVWPCVLCWFLSLTFDYWFQLYTSIHTYIHPCFLLCACIDSSIEPFTHTYPPNLSIFLPSASRMATALRSSTMPWMTGIGRALELSLLIGSGFPWFSTSAKTQPGTSKSTRTPPPKLCRITWERRRGKCLMPGGWN